MRLKVAPLLLILLFGFIAAVAPLYSYECEPRAFAYENSNSIELESQYFKTANVYKGQLHCHTTNSDGAQSPLEVVTAYKNAGYDFIAITDHDYVTPDPRVEGILFITGNEVSSTLGHITTIDVSSVPPSLDAQEVIDWTKAQGGLVWLAHPSDQNHWAKEEIASISGYQGTEVYNHPWRSYAEEKWDYVLTELNRKTTAIAVDDCHSVTKSNLFNGGWVMVFADSLKKSDICNSLEKGNFYSTQGPIINAVEVEGNTISIKLKQTSKVTWIGRGGSILQETTGIMQDSYVARGNEKYIRILVESSGYAWTNPIYVPNHIVYSASVSDSRVNPSQLITISGQVYYWDTTIAPASRSAVQAYVTLNGENKVALSVIRTDGSFTFPSFPAESAVGVYNYNVYTVWNGQISAQNQTVPVIVDGLKVSNYTINLRNDEVQVRLLYAYDDETVQNGNVTYAGLFAYTNIDGWATFNLSSIREIKWNSTAYVISEPSYDLTVKLQNQTVGYAKITIANFIIKSDKPITNARWNLLNNELSFSSSGTINVDADALGKPMNIELEGATYTDWTYDSTMRQVIANNVHGRIVLKWASYSTELWIIATFTSGIAMVTAVILFKKR